MNIQTRPPTTPDEFPRWNEGREGKREFVRGKVALMTISVTRNHARIAANAIMALGRRLDLSRFYIGSADIGVRTPDGVRYPDVYVDRRTSAARGDDLAAIEPVLLAEIHSPSSLGRNFVEKMADYRRVAALHHYLILSHEEPRAWVTTRGNDGWTEPGEVAGVEGILRLSALLIDLPLCELFENVDMRRPS